MQEQRAGPDKPPRHIGSPADTISRRSGKAVKHLEQVRQIPVQERQRVLSPRIVARRCRDDGVHVPDLLAAAADLACEHPAFRPIEAAIWLVELKRRLSPGANGVAIDHCDGNTNSIVARDCRPRRALTLARGTSLSPRNSVQFAVISES